MKVYSGGNPVFHGMAGQRNEKVELEHVDDQDGHIDEQTEMGIGIRGFIWGADLV